MTISTPPPSEFFRRSSGPGSFQTSTRFNPGKLQEPWSVDDWGLPPHHEAFSDTHEPLHRGRISSLPSHGKSASGSDFWAEAGIAVGLMLCGWGLLLHFCLGGWILTAMLVSGAISMAIGLNGLRKKSGKR
ncbi:MAG: hypothetical protein JWM59_4399 [Verrucomicrobiales bacterium]|nr:hypothetical protein [Verrucomicrobiales bacterium]